MLLVHFLCVYLYCRRVFYFGPHNISWLYELGLHIYHCRMEVILAPLVIGFCNACQGHPTFIVWVWCTPGGALHRL